MFTYPFWQLIGIGIDLFTHFKLLILSFIILTEPLIICLLLLLLIYIFEFTYVINITKL